MPVRDSIRTLLVSFLLLRFTVAGRKCYALNGTQLGNEYGPCNLKANQHSGCCAINRPTGSKDFCLSNGLCMATNDDFMGTVWQNGCTDPTGMDPSCPKMCPDARSNSENSSTVPAAAWNIQTCDFGSYCCRAVGDHNSCCNNATAPKIKTKSLGAFLFETAPAPPSSTIQGSVAATTSNPTASPATTICAPEKRRIAVVGGTLAGIFSAAIVGLLVVIFYLFQKEKRQRKLKEHYEEQFATTTWGAYGKGMASRSTIAETDAGRDPAGNDVEVRFIGKQRDS